MLGISWSSQPVRRWHCTGHVNQNASVDRLHIFLLLLPWSVTSMTVPREACSNDSHRRPSVPLRHCDRSLGQKVDSHLLNYDHHQPCAVDLCPTIVPGRPDRPHRTGASCRTRRPDRGRAEGRHRTRWLVWWHFASAEVSSSGN